MSKSDEVIIIGIRGKAGSGKDTMADFLVKNYGFTKMSFATALKKIVVILTGWDMDFVNGTNPELRPLRETLIHPFYNKTCRQLMQFIGTDLLRNQLHSDIWIETVRNGMISYVQQCRANKKQARIVFTDARFPNETAMIQKANGRMVKIIRPRSNSVESLISETKNHVSEEDFQVDDEIVITNDSCVENYLKKIKKIIKEDLDIISKDGLMRL